MADPIRERVLLALKEWFEAQAAGDPAGDPYAFGWDLVTREPMGPLVRGKNHVLGIYDSTEQKAALTGYTKDATMQVVLEWRQRVPTDAEAGSEVSSAREANLVLGAIQRRLGEIATTVEAPYTRTFFDALVIDVDETGNEVDIENFDDRYVGGVVFVEVRYKHASRDPRASVG